MFLVRVNTRAKRIPHTHKTKPVTKFPIIFNKSNTIPIIMIRVLLTAYSCYLNNLQDKAAIINIVT